MSKVTKPVLVYPEVDWLTGYSDESNTNGGNINYVGCKPYESKLFNMNWKVKRVNQVQLMGANPHPYSHSPY